MKNPNKHIKEILMILSLLLFIHSLHAQYDSGTTIYSEAGDNTLVSVLKNYTIGDFDGDNFADVILIKDSTANTPNQLTWFKGDGNGEFIEQNSISNIDNTYQENAIFYGDINGDGNKDIIQKQSDTEFKIYFSDGVGGVSSQSENTFAISDLNEISLKSIADIDGDNDMDIILWCSIDYELFPTIAYNDGNGNFSNYELLENEAEKVYNLIETGDMDGDGDLDIFCSGNNQIGSAGGFGPTIYLQPFVHWYENLGDGNFAAKQEIILPEIDSKLPDFTHIKINDIDNDSNDELLIEYAILEDCEEDLHQIDCIYFYRFSVLDYEEEAMTFVQKEEYNSWLHGYTIPQNVYSHSQFYTEAFHYQLGDNDGDGSSDILSINVPQSRLQWFYGNGEGGFDDPEIVHSNSEYSNFKPALRLADIDNDQDLDVFVLINTPTSSTLTVFENLTPVGIKDIIAGNENIGFSPNPTTSNSYVELSLPRSERSQDLPYMIRNTSGKIVRTAKCDHGKIFINNLSQGIYFVEITAKEKRYIGKLVIK